MYRDVQENAWGMHGECMGNVWGMHREHTHGEHKGTSKLSGFWFQKVQKKPHTTIAC